MKLAFISSTNEGNPPIDMNVTKPNTKDAHDPLACLMSRKTRKKNRENQKLWRNEGEFPYTYYHIPI